MSHEILSPFSGWNKRICKFIESIKHVIQIEVPTFTKVKINFENHLRYNSIFIHINVAYYGTAKLISVHVPDFLVKGQVSRFDIRVL